MIIELQDLKESRPVEGLVLIQEHGKKTDTSNRPLKGSFIHKGKVVSFNVWSSTGQSIIDVLNQHDLSGRICYITGNFKTSAQYGDSIDVTSIIFDTERQFPDVTMAHFLKSVDVQTMSNDLWTFVQQELTPEHFHVANIIMGTNNTWSKFTMAFAGKKMHDAQVGGLMNHTFKMMKIAKTLLENDTRHSQWYSLLQLSILLHDVGKIEELGQLGEYQENSFTTHRIIGVEMLSELKQQILHHISLHDFRIILSVLTGHHGEYEEKAKTVLAQIVHLIDMLEANTTGMLDMIENGETKESYGAVRVWSNGENLAL